MATEFASQLLAYHAFVKSTLTNGGSIDKDATPEAFLEYQRQLEQLRRELEPGVSRFRRGESAGQIDFDDLIQRILPGNTNQGE